MKIVAALGNPGRQYADTRHNAGWMAADEVARRCGAKGETVRCGGMFVRISAEGLGLFKPMSYMNLCGQPVSRICRQTGAGLDELLILVDDLNLPLGGIRLRPGGASGGHKGLKSLVQALGTDQFPRLRMGIGPRPAGVPGRDFVLSPFTRGEWDAVDPMVERAADAAGATGGRSRPCCAGPARCRGRPRAAPARRGRRSGSA